MSVQGILAEVGAAESGDVPRGDEDGLFAKAVAAAAQDAGNPVIAMCRNRHQLGDGGPTIGQTGEAVEQHEDGWAGGPRTTGGQRSESGATCQALGRRATDFIAVAHEKRGIVTDLAEAEELHVGLVEAGIVDATAEWMQVQPLDLPDATVGMRRAEELDAPPMPDPGKAMRGHTDYATQPRER